MLTQTQEQFEAVFNNIPVAVILMDDSCRVKLFNRIAAKTFLLKSPTHVNMPISKLVSARFLPQEIKLACSPHHLHKIEEIRFTTKANQSIFLNIFTAGIKSVSTRRQWIVMLVDVTDAVNAKKLVSTLTNRILQAHEDEKQMLSREIHDTVSQSLAALKMLIQSDSDKISLIHQINQLIQVTRTLSQNLRPDVIDKIGLIPALEQLAESIEQCFNSRVHINAFINHDQLNSNVSLQLYRITQEAVLNAARHGRAKDIYVTLSKRKDKLRLVIKDNGKGFNSKQIIESAAKSRSLGLNIMLERTKQIKGHFSLYSKINQGTIITVTSQISSDNNKEKKL